MGQILNCSAGSSYSLIDELSLKHRYLIMTSILLKGGISEKGGVYRR